MFFEQATEIRRQEIYDHESSENYMSFPIREKKLFYIPITIMRTMTELMNVCGSSV